MFALVVSPSAIVFNASAPNQFVIDELISIAKSGVSTYVLSNHEKPSWFDIKFNNSGVVFAQRRGRQNGQVIREISDELNMPTYNVLVLAGSEVDIHMAKNGGSVLFGASWVNNKKIKMLGIKIDAPSQLGEAICLLKEWKGDWWYRFDLEKYSVRALMDLSEYGKSDAQVRFSQALKSTVKQGSGKLAALLIITSRSLLIDGIGGEESLFWGVYPSSKLCLGGDVQVLSSFTHRLRTTVSLVRYAKVDEPLFIRHAASEKRSHGSGRMTRTNPENQITTLHLNQFYKRSIRGRNVIIVDDCTTYGVSFGVASAFLLAAGARSIKCIALGKFGKTISYFDIDITTDPFKPVGVDGFRLNSTSYQAGVTEEHTQEILLKLF